MTLEEPFECFSSNNCLSWSIHLYKEQLEDLLLDIREEFRQLLYHIHGPEFFRIAEPTHDWLALSEKVKR